MDFFSQNKIISYDNPIDCIEENAYKFSEETYRDSVDHLIIRFKGSWKSYDIIISWDGINKVLNISSFFEFEIKKKSIKSLYDLISAVNEKVNLGYFHYCSQHKRIFFKYQVSTKGFNFLTFEQIEEFLSVVIKECDRFFPVFFLCISRNKSPDLCINNSLIDKYGQA